MPILIALACAPADAGPVYPSSIDPSSLAGCTVDGAVTQDDGSTSTLQMVYDLDARLVYDGWISDGSFRDLFYTYDELGCEILWDYHLEDEGSGYDILQTSECDSHQNPVITYWHSTEDTEDGVLTLDSETRYANTYQGDFLTRRTRSSDSSGETTHTYAYDVYGRTTRVEYYVGSSLEPTSWWEYEWDDDNVTAIRGNNGGGETFEYDSQDRRIVEVSFPDGSRVVSSYEGSWIAPAVETHDRYDDGTIDWTTRNTYTCPS